MNINVSADIKAATRHLSRIQKQQIPFAASGALNHVAFVSARKELPMQTDKVFDGGAVRFTQTGFRYKKASKRELIATVFIDPAREAYLRFMVQGGTRFPNNRAILVSTKHSKLNKFGNIPRGTLKRMIEDKNKFFKGIPKGRQGEHLAGIWERYGRKTKQGGQRIRMVANYEGKAQYTPKFPFGTFVEGVVFSRKDGFAVIFQRNLERALRTAR